MGSGWPKRKIALCVCSIDREFGCRYFDLDDFTVPLVDLSNVHMCNFTTDCEARSPRTKVVGLERISHRAFQNRFHL